MSVTTRRLSWLALAAVVGVALVVGGFGDRRPRTVEEQVDAIASTVKCPTCRIAASASDAPASVAMRAEIKDRVEQGQDAGEIRAYFASRYGESMLLTPRASGVAGLVWMLPVAALVLAVGGLGFAFWRWRRWAT